MAKGCGSVFRYVMAPERFPQKVSGASQMPRVCRTEWRNSKSDAIHYYESGGWHNSNGVVGIADGYAI